MSTVSIYFSSFQSDVGPNNPPPSQPATSGKRKRFTEDEDEDDAVHHRPPNQDSVRRGVETLSSVLDTSTRGVGWQSDGNTAAEGSQVNSNGAPHLLTRRSSVTSQIMPSPDIRRELAACQPPLVGAFQHGSKILSADLLQRKGLRRQHLSALIAVMHRSVLDGEFQRAGRAWGMLLRAELNGQSLDLRKSSRWGLGAEMYLQQNPQEFASFSGRNRGLGASQLGPTQYRKSYSLTNFVRTKDYFERLILQYPYRKSFPHLTGPVEFYLALFGLWIRSIIDEQWLAVREQLAPVSIGKQDREDVAEEHEKLERESPSSRASTPEQLDRQRMCRDTLQRIDGLADRLDGLLSSPPYSDNASFWNLRGMVALWIADLTFPSRLNRSGEAIRKGYNQLTLNDFNRLQEIVTSLHDRNVDCHDTVVRAKALLRARDAFSRAISCRDASSGS